MAGDNQTSMTLLQRMRDGDSSGWHRVVELYEPLVVFWCQRRGVPTRDLPDLVQEVWAAAASGIGTFRRDRSADTFRGWLRAITHHKSAEYWRRQAGELSPEGGSTAHERLQQIAGAVDPAAPGDESSPDPGEQTHHNALFARAMELIRDEFEPTTWQAFWRTAVDGQSAPDVAGEVGISANAVRMAKSRVLRRLRAELGDLID